MAGLIIAVLLLGSAAFAFLVLFIHMYKRAAAAERILEPITSVEKEIDNARNKLDTINRLIEAADDQRARERVAREQERVNGEEELHDLRTKLGAYRDAVELQEYGIHRAAFTYEHSETYQLRLKQIRDDQKRLVREKKAATCPIEWTVEGSKAKGQQMTDRNLRLMLRAFNGECDAAIKSATARNVLRMGERIKKAFDSINTLGKTHKCSLNPEYLRLRMQELGLAEEYLRKKEEEKEEQRAIREQMREEARAQRELEAAQKKAEDEERQRQLALAQARQELESKQGAERDAMEERIRQLEAELSLAHERTVRAISRAQLTRSGYVYVISNVGSFGEDVYKIGMTRRLEPMDRVRELGDASVPFTFDVHAIIYSNDAPALEAELHRKFDDRRLNAINRRKEFFRCDIDELAATVRELDAEIEFTKLAEASEYHQTLELRHQENVEEEMDEELELI